MQKTAEKATMKNKAKILKILALTEDEADAPVTYYVVDNICDKLSLPMPPLKAILAALRKDGFQAIQTHFNTKGIRTDASAKKIASLLLDRRQK